MLRCRESSADGIIVPLKYRALFSTASTQSGHPKNMVINIFVCNDLLHARRMEMTIWLQRLNLGLLASVIAGLDPPIYLAEE
jgi:hypothetical protein